MKIRNTIIEHFPYSLSNYVCSPNLVERYNEIIETLKCRNIDEFIGVTADNDNVQFTYMSHIDNQVNMKVDVLDLDICAGYITVEETK